MKIITFTTVFLIASAGLVDVFGAGIGVQPLMIDPEPADKNSSSTTPAPSSSTEKPTTPTTTVKPTTPTTTVKPTTPTTTVKPTTPTTTVKPTTPTTKPTTPAPTPKPVPTALPWTIDYPNTNKTCIMLNVTLEYEFIELNNTKVNVPLTEVKVTGNCGESNNTKEYLQIDWAVNNTVRFEFFKNNSKFELDSINSKILVNGSVKTLKYSKPEFPTSLENSYKCAKVQTLNLTEENANKTIAFLHVSDLQFQAFMNSTEHKFDSAIDCDGYITKDIVPIVVGCVLAVMVVLILVAYLVGRRRCQARGYLSM